MSRKLRSAIAAAVFLLAQPAAAGAIAEVVLDPITHVEASLVIVGADGAEKTYTAAQLETFPTYSLTTSTPWRDDPADFQGVLLSDVLAASGLEGSDAIVVTAENDFSTVITNEVMQDVDILVATRVNGQAHTRRERGPIQFVIDSEAFNASDAATASDLVWMAARIEAQN